MKLTNQQQEALSRIEDFIRSDRNVFILKGYAGTGKTTLIRELVRSLEKNGKQFSVMAPTGRAAKILRDKTDHGQTIHKTIYNYHDVKILEDEEKSESGLSYKYYFPVDILENTGHISIVDEASMVSNQENAHELMQFGTDKLLPDLLTYTRAPGNNKIIFVGDPAQLEPVGDKNSYALDAAYFKKLGFVCEEYEITEIVRQKAGSTLLDNATKIRELLQTEEKSRGELYFDFDEEVKRLPETKVVENYIRDYPKPSLESGVIINYKNRDCLSYNQQVREKYFPGEKAIQPGDVIMVVKNSYSTWGTPMFNGDMAQVLEVGVVSEKQSAPVIVNREGKKNKVVFHFKFRDVTIKVPEYDNPLEVKIIESMLDQDKGRLEVDEMRALFINFNMRFQEEQNIRKKKGLGYHKRGSEVYKNMLKTDPYFNALQVKYGYSITCHKAQGGEWDRVYVNFMGKEGLKDPHLRWSYTAITRGKKSLYAINPPHVTAFSGITFNTVGQIRNIPEEAVTFGNIPETPFHNEFTHPAKRQLYFEVLRKLEDTSYSLNRVESREYQEMYHIQGEVQEYRFDTTHNRAGLFKPFTSSTQNEDVSEILSLLNKPVDKIFSFLYEPSSTNMEKLYGKVRAACADTDVSITNVVEKPENHQVLYYFYFEGVYSVIQFYYRSNGQFTTANPKITDMRQRELLLNIIDKLS